MHIFDGYKVLTQPVRHVSEAQAELFLARVYGMEGVSVRRIVTERDDTFAVAGDSSGTGGTRWVLKIENPAEAYEAVEMRARALQRVECSPDGIPAMRVVPALDGSLVTRLDDCGDGIDGEEDVPRDAAAHPAATQTRAASVTTFVDGTVLAHLPMPYEPRLVDDIGIRLAQVQKALAGLQGDDIGFSDVRGRILWDVDLVSDLAQDLSGLLDSPRQRRLVERAAAGYDAIRPILSAMPVQYCHGDFHPGNLIVRGPRSMSIRGIIDFGDMHVMPVVTDLGTCLTYLIDFDNGNHAFDVCRRAFAAYCASRPGFDPALARLLPAIFKARIALAILLPIMVERYSGARPGHYLATTSRRFRQLEMLERWTDGEIASMLLPDGTQS